LGGERVRILAAHLFGREPAVSEGPSVAQAMALKLSGTISLADPARGAAIIAGADGNSHLVHTGEPLPGGATLLAVYADHVVLQGLDGEQVLRLPKLQPGAAGGVLESQSGEEVADARTRADADDGQDPFAPPPLPTPGAVLRSLNLRPAIRNGDPIGMRIGGDAASAAALAKIGLRPGDVLVSVNGEPAQGSSAGAIMRAVGAGETATLSVEHDGAMINVDVGTEQADAMANAYREQASTQ
jgi:type II secretory pathway component PulC